MNFEKAVEFIWRHGRLLERRVFEYVFQEGSKDRVLNALKAYPNADGLDALESQQEDDGGWPIQWDPPGETARLEWRAYTTLKSLMILNSYNRGSIC